MAEEKISTGIEGLDEHLGGFQKNGRFLLSGGRATAKSIFSVQFLRACLENEQRCVLISTNPEAFLSLSEELETPLEHYVRNEELIILRHLTWTQEIISSDEILSDMLSDLSNLVIPAEATSLVIDSAVPLIQMFHSDYLEEGIPEFLNEINQLELTLLMTTLMPGSRKALAIRKFIEERMTGVIHMDEHIRPDGTVTRNWQSATSWDLCPPSLFSHAELKKEQELRLQSLVKPELKPL